MSRRDAVEGSCAICGNVGPLTFEHLPPKKAFNNRRTISLSWDAAMRLGPDMPVKRDGRITQGGVGRYTLCSRCNNDTGSWYAPELVNWCYRGMEILERSSRTARSFHIRRGRPLLLLKQIMTMFCSLNPRMARVQPWIQRLVLNREQRGLADGWRIFLYYNLDGKMRYLGAATTFDLERGRATVLSELSYPPFGYVLVMNGAPPPDSRLVEISHFAEYRYGDESELFLPLDLLPTHVVYPGDYRGLAQIAVANVP